MRYWKILTTVLVLALSLASPRWVSAGLADEVPLLNGTLKGKAVWSTGGFATSTTTAAVFSCTSTEKLGGKNITWGVEIFDSGSLMNDVTSGNGVVTMLPGSTFTVATRSTAFFAEDEIIGVDAYWGAARILSTSSKMICTAYVVEESSDPPTMMITLPLFGKGKQKGQ